MKKKIDFFHCFALMKLSAIGITNLSGKAGGSVFAHNKGGMYTRNFAVPSNPKSAAQEIVRGSFGGFAQAWRGLTQQQRDAWYAALDDYKRTNRFGDQKTLTGLSLFVSLNQNLTNGFQQTISVPLAPVGTNAPISLTDFKLEIDPAGNIATASATLKSDENVSATSQTVIIEATPATSPGVRNFANRFRKVGTAALTGESQAVEIKTEYPTVFGVPAVGSKVAFRAKLLNDTTGEVSTYVSVSGLVTQGV